MRGATSCFLLQYLWHLNFYSRASCEARLCSPWVPIDNAPISTHAPLARRDRTFFSFMFSTIHFYSRASCEARLHKKSRSAKVLPHFYSRASCEARLMVVRPAGVLPVNFYSRASCEARHCFFVFLMSAFGFLLTRLLRGATPLQSLNLLKF